MAINTRSALIPVQTIQQNVAQQLSVPVADVTVSQSNVTGLVTISVASAPADTNSSSLDLPSIAAAAGARQFRLLDVGSNGTALAPVATPPPAHVPMAIKIIASVLGTIASVSGVICAV